MLTSRLASLWQTPKRKSPIPKIKSSITPLNVTIRKTTPQNLNNTTKTTKNHKKALHEIKKIYPMRDKRAYYITSN